GDVEGRRVLAPLHDGRARQGVRGARRLDLHHLGTERREQEAGVRGREPRRALDHSEVREGCVLGHGGRGDSSCGSLVNARAGSGRARALDQSIWSIWGLVRQWKPGIRLPSSTCTPRKASTQASSNRIHGAPPGWVNTPMYTSAARTSSTPPTIFRGVLIGIPLCEATQPRGAYRPLRVRT